MKRIYIRDEIIGGLAGQLMAGADRTTLKQLAVIWSIEWWEVLSAAGEEEIAKGA